MTNPHSVGGHRLFFQPADGQHAPAQRDLARHSQVAANGPARERGDNGGGDGDAGRGPILGNSAFRQMDMEVEVIGKPRRDLQLIRA